MAKNRVVRVIAAAAAWCAVLALETGQAAVRADGPTPTPIPTTPHDALCALYPAYCVPLVGAPSDSTVSLPGFEVFESAAARTLPADSTALEPVAAPGVVRGVTAEGLPFLGDPAAPIRFRLAQNFTCSHCQDFHETDLARFITDDVLTGRAVLEIDLMAFGAEPYSTYAATAALCAGEQGAFWEVQDALFDLAREYPPSTGFDVPHIRDAAAAIGLDGDALAECVIVERTADLLDQHETTAFESGVTATPTVLMWVTADGQWEKVNRAYDNLAALTEAAAGSAASAG